MEKKKTWSWWVWIILIFIVLWVLDDMPGWWWTGMIVLVRVAIIGFALKDVLFGKKGVATWGFSQLTEHLKEMAVEKTQEYIQTHPNDPNTALLQEQIQPFLKETPNKTRKTSQPSRVQHNLSGTNNESYNASVSQKNYTWADSSTDNAFRRNTARTQQHSLSGKNTVVYTNSEAQKNYTGSWPIVEDVLTKTTRNPYSLDGK